MKINSTAEELFTAEVLNSIFKLYFTKNYESFDKKFYVLHYLCLRDMEKKFMGKFNKDKTNAKDALQDAYLKFFIDLSNAENYTIKSTKDLKSTIYKSAVDIFYRQKKKKVTMDIVNHIDDSENNVNQNTNLSSNKNYDTSIHLPDYIIPSIENDLIDEYNGNENVVNFLEKENNCLELLKLKYINNLNYDKIQSLPHYSEFSLVTLRQKTSRCLKKFKIFFNK